MADKPFPFQQRSLLPLTLWAILLTVVLIFGRAAQLVPAAGLIITILWAVLGVTWLWLVVRLRPRAAVTPLDLGLLALLAALVLTSFFSIDPSRSWRMAWYWSTCLLAFVFALTFLRAGLPPRQLAGLVVAILSVFIFLGYRDLAGWWVDTRPALLAAGLAAPLPTVRGLTGSTNLLAILLALGSLLALAFWRESGRRGWPAAAWLALALPVLLLTGSRSGLLALAAGLFTFSALTFLQEGQLPVPRRLRLPLALGLPLLLAAAAWLLITIRPGVLSNATIVVRFSLWQVALANFLAHPWLGSGLDTFATANLLQNRPLGGSLFLRAAHSLWLTTLSGMGLLGGGGLLLLAGQLLAAVRRRPAGRSPLTNGLAAALTALLVHATIDTPEPWVLLLGAVLLALFLYQLDPAPPTAGRWGSAPVWVWAAVWATVVASGLYGYPLAARYQAGIDAAEAGDWERAAAELDQSIDYFLFEDTAALLAAGLAHGVLAADNPAHLPTAIARLERGAAQEPGWPGTHLNLAQLYQAAGRAEEGRAAMDTALALAPENPVVRLNDALLREAQGEPAAAAWRALYALPGGWQGGALWPALLPEEAAAARTAEEPLWAALLAGDPAATADLGRPLTPLERGLLALLEGDEAAAAVYFEGAAAGGGRFDAFLWREWLAQADEPPADQQGWNRDQLGRRTLLGIGQEAAGVYPMDIFNRSSLPVDLVPAVRCFVSNDTLDRYLSLLQVWHTRRGTPTHATWAAEFVPLDPPYPGVVPCTEKRESPE